MPIPPRSERAAGRVGERADAKAAAFVAAGRRCVLWWHPTPCSGPIDGHEVVRRSCHADAAYDAALIVPLCRAHHDLDGSEPEAVRLGIRVPCWVWERDGLDAVREQARRRQVWATGRTPELPEW